MANMVTCPTGLHPYDAERYKVCPYCGTSAVQQTARRAALPPEEQRSHTSPAGLDTASPGGPAPTQYQGRIRSGVRPVYGWLVVVGGPGRGSALPVYAGTNNIGRGEDQDIRLRFQDGEDTEIGRSSHALLRVDPTTLQFAVAHKDGKNLTYVNSVPVFEPYRLLNPHDRIRIGQTTLMFVPLCGEHFRWDPESTDAA